MGIRVWIALIGVFASFVLAGAGDGVCRVLPFAARSGGDTTGIGI